MTVKIKRGQKLCQSCNTINGVRSFECKNCGAEFKMKKFRRGKRKVLVTNHLDLIKGNLIRVVGGSGPYYEDNNGERHYLIDRGKYTVDHVDNNGIHAYGSTGYNYLYMGEIRKSNILDSIIKSPCKILLLKERGVSHRK